MKMKFLEMANKILKEENEIPDASQIMNNLPGEETESNTLTNNGGVEQGEEEEDKQFIAGGKADGMTPDEIAKRLGIDVAEVEKAIDQGSKVELEHTSDPAVADSIAADHIIELGTGYYDALIKMEEELKGKQEKPEKKEKEDKGEKKEDKKPESKKKVEKEDKLEDDKEEKKED